MIRVFLLLLLFACSFSFARAEVGENIPRTSLFLTAQEAQEAGTLARKSAPMIEDGNVHLGAVLYYGYDDWTLWLQGEKWTPQTSHENLQVLDVSENEVRLAWREEGGTTLREITLKPNQSFDATTGKIASKP